MQTKKTAEMIGAFLGSFISTDTVNSEGLWKDFMRVRVQMDISKPIKRKMKVKPSRSEPFYIEFKYERLPTFCFLCGLIGHNENSCDILFDSNTGNIERAYGPELRATGRRSQPCAGQRWILPELPRRKPDGESQTEGVRQKNTFATDNSSAQTDIPNEETAQQMDQSTTLSPVTQHGAVHRINDHLSTRGKNLMQIDVRSPAPCADPTDNGSPVGPSTDIIGLKRKKMDFGPVHVTNFTIHQDDFTFPDGSLNLLEAGPAHQACLDQ